MAEQALVELLQSTEKLAEEREKVPILMHVSVHIPCGKHDTVGRFAARLRCHGGEICGKMKVRAALTAHTLAVARRAARGNASATTASGE